MARLEEDVLPHSELLFAVKQRYSPQNSHSLYPNPDVPEISTVTGW